MCPAVVGAKLTAARNSLKINVGKHLDIMQVKGEPKRAAKTKTKIKMNDLKYYNYEQEKVKTKIQASEQRNARGDAGGLPDGGSLD